MQKLPPPLRELVHEFSKLPGLGPKSALRCALTLLKWPQRDVAGFGNSISNLHSNLALCERCGSLASASPCEICINPSRDGEIICVVSEWDSLLVMEEGGFFKGRYLVLGGLLSPLDNIRSEDLEIDRLKARLAEGVIKEVVLALGATVEAETTASYLKSMIETGYPFIKISRLAQGIPLGGEVKFMDKETLKQSLKYRQNF